MPVTVRKVDGYRVSTPGGVKAKNTTAKKAMAQRRLLQMVKHGGKPTGKKKSKISDKAVRKFVMARRAQKKKT